MTTTAYRLIPYAVHAVRWTGDNYAEVRQFLLDNGIEDDCIGWDGAMDEHRVFQFYAWDDDQEVDPGRWIVVHTDPTAPGPDTTSPPTRADACTSPATPATTAATPPRSTATPAPTAGRCSTSPPPKHSSRHTDSAPTACPGRGGERYGQPVWWCGGFLCAFG